MFQSSFIHHIKFKHQSPHCTVFIFIPLQAIVILNNLFKVVCKEFTFFYTLAEFLPLLLRYRHMYDHDMDMMILKEVKISYKTATFLFEVLAVCQSNSPKQRLINL